MTAQQSYGGHFALVDHTGRPVTERDFLGRYLPRYFGYTHCADACPTTLQTVTVALRWLDDPAALQPLFISVDPALDSPERLAGYIGHFHSFRATLPAQTPRRPG